MSSNETIFPGMENNGSYESFNPGASGINSFNNGGTVFPGISTTESNKGTSNTKPIIGFLYSISRTAAGEYWPLHIGPNTIGRSADCDVCLKEATVSGEHAKLVVRLMKNPEKTICSLQDSASTCGSMVNGNSLGFEPIECRNGDIITIGEHYQLYIILIDTKELGLTVNDGFIKAEEGNPFQQYPEPAPWEIQQPFAPEGAGGNFPNGTIGMKGTEVQSKKGCTIIMPKK